MKNMLKLLLPLTVISAVCGVIAAVLLAYKGKGLTTVAIISCVVVFLAESVL